MRDFSSLISLDGEREFIVDILRGSEGNSEGQGVHKSINNGYYVRR